jgi:hypothetical protein
LHLDHFVDIYLRSELNDEESVRLDEDVETREPEMDESEGAEIVCGIEDEAEADSDDIVNGLDEVNSEVKLDAGNELDCVGELASAVPESVTDDDSDREVEEAETDESEDSSEFVDED